MSTRTEARPLGLARVSALGPAFVASVAYVDPGNVAANLTAGSRYGYLLVWVLVLASLMAVIVQYLSAKLGIVTGSTLSSEIGARLDGLSHGRPLRLAFWVQAMAVAIATDIAEVIGGALGLYLLFGLPLWVGGILVGAMSLVLLEALRRRGERVFEIVVTGVLGLVAAGFLTSLMWVQVEPREVLAGMRPRFDGADSRTLAAAMLGATVMPHAIYLHSALARDRHRPDGVMTRPIGELLRIQRTDVLASLALAGSVNVAMLLFAAAALRASSPPDSIVGAHHAIRTTVGAVPAMLFGFGLLASGVGSSVVGTHAGSRIMKDLLPFALPHQVRRIVVIVPALGLLLAGVDPTTALVESQLVLSFGIAFALVPLAWLTGRPALMGRWVNPWWLQAVSWAIVAAIVSLNVWLLLG